MFIRLGKYTVNLEDIRKYARCGDIVNGFQYGLLVYNNGDNERISQSDVDRIEKMLMKHHLLEYRKVESGNE